MLTTDITRLRSWILREFDQSLHGFANPLTCSSTTWFQFDDEVVTKINFLGEKRYTGKDIVDVLNDSGAAKKCVSPSNWIFLMFIRMSGVGVNPARVPRRSEGSTTVTMRS